MKLAPKMIQSMEVLQLPLLALQEKIEAELNSNPVLELAEDETEEEGGVGAEVEAGRSGEGSRDDGEDAESKELVVGEEGDRADDFERLAGMEDGFEDYLERVESYPRRGVSEDRDKKMEALGNTPSQSKSLNERLVEQWALVDADEKVKEAGRLIIDYIDEKGYLSVGLEELASKRGYDFGLEELEKALELVQQLEPAGVGARDLRECLLIQMGQSEEDMSFEEELVRGYWDALLENRLPEIAKRMGSSVERINEAVRRMSKLDTSPGLQVGRDENYPITADVIVEQDAETGEYRVRLADAQLPRLRVNKFYLRMAKNKKVDEQTRRFLQKNIHSAKWFMEAIEQRKETLLKVAQAVVNHQREFFEKGQLYLKPLPMSKIAEEVGVHVATVSRAAAGKYIQSPQGIFALRSFFNSGKSDGDGKEMSWKVVKEEIRRIVEQEDKSRPLSDDEIRKKLEEKGIKGVARRTVAKYRKQMNIPAARFRRKY